MPTDGADADRPRRIGAKFISGIDSEAELKSRAAKVWVGHYQVVAPFEFARAEMILNRALPNGLSAKKIGAKRFPVTLALWAAKVYFIALCAPY